MRELKVKKLLMKTRSRLCPYKEQIKHILLTASTPGPASAVKHPPVFKSVTLDDLGTHHLSASDMSDAGESVGVRSPLSNTTTSPQVQAAASPVYIRKSGTTEEDAHSLRNLLLSQNDDMRDAKKLVALSSSELQALQGVLDTPLRLIDFSSTVSDLLVKSETNRHALIGVGHLQDALNAAMARTNVLEEQLNVAIAEAKHHEGRAFAQSGAASKEKAAFSKIVREEIAAAKEEVSAVQRSQHQDALESLRDEYKTHKGTLEGQLEYHKQKLETERENFEKTARELRDEHDKALSTLKAEQDQNRIAIIKEYEEKLTALRSNADAKHSNLCRAARR